MRQYLTATIQAMGQNELNDIVDPLVIKHIKENDPHPEIRVYSVGHEGRANLTLPGFGIAPFVWIQAAVRKIAEKLKLGTPVFDQHGLNTNSHEGRIQIGQVVGKVVKEVGDRLNTLAAIHIFPQFKSRPLDIASIETEMEFAHDEHQAWPTDIGNVSGIALGNSGTDTPGFPGATLLGAVQAYVQAFGSEIGDKPMNKSDVQQAAKDLGLKPSQVFSVDDLMGDNVVDEKVKEKTKEHFAMAKRVGEERDGLRDKVVKLENEKAGSDKKLQQFQMQSKSATFIDAILTDRKLDDKAKTFVKRNLRNFTAEATDEDKLKAELGKFVDDTNKEYQELAKDVFGVDKIDQSSINTQYRIPPEFLVDGQTPAGSTPAALPQIPPTRDEVLQTEMNPALNPLIPGGKAAQEALKT